MSLDGEMNEKSGMKGESSYIQLAKADFQWGRRASAAKSAQAAAAPEPLRCLGGAVRISRTACKALLLVSYI